MRNMDNKSLLFKATYNLCRKQKIDFTNFDKLTATIEQKKVEQIFIRRNRSKYFSEFINFYKTQIEKEKPLLIVEKKEDINNLYENFHKVDISFQRIYGGFIYLNRKKFLLLDRSYKNILNTIGNKYIKLENRIKRNSSYE